MKRLHILFVFLPALFQGFKSHGQDSLSHLAVVISPALFIPVSVAVQGGLQLKLTDQWSVLAEVAVPTFHPTNNPYEEIRYWRAGTEIRRRIKKQRSSGTYISLAATYLYRKLVDKEQAFYYTKTQTYSYQNAVINAPVLSSALKFGIELPAGKRVFVDGFVGLGARAIFTDYTTEKAVLTSLEPVKPKFFRFDDAWLFNYTLLRVHATAGLRLGVRL